MKIVIPGGSGQVGTVLARAFHAAGHQVVVLSRRPSFHSSVTNAHASTPWRVVAWDGVTLGDWTREIDGCDAVINMAGRSVNCRYHGRNRREIMNSRVLSTRVVGQAIAQARRPPRVWLQASTATIYAHRYDQPNDEYSGILGGAGAIALNSWQFSIDVARAWERGFDEAVTAGTRKVALRSAMTLSPDRGGVFAMLLALVRYGLGGRAGDGRQFMSWVHYEDFVAAVAWLIDRDDMSGVVNIAAPHPLPNEKFMRLLRAAYGRSFGLPATNWMIEVGTFLLRTESELILKSRRVVPGRLLDKGFEFRFPDWQSAARDLCKQYRHRASADSEVRQAYA